MGNCAVSEPQVMRIHDSWILSHISFIMPDRRTLEISWGSLWRVLFFVAFIAVLFEGRQIILGLLLAIIISSGLEIMVDFLEKKGIPRTLGVILIFLAALFLLVILTYAIVPLVIVDLNTVFASLDRANPNTAWGFLANLKASQSLDSVVSKLSQQFFSSGISPLDMFSNALGSFGLALAVIVSSFYLSLGRDGVERFIKIMFPPDYEKAALKIYESSRRKIGFWFQAQIALSVIMGLSVWGALTLLGVKHAFLLGAIAALFELAPFVGPILSGATAVLVALSISVPLAFYTLLVFLFLQQFESNILVPIFMRRSIGLHPVIVIIALLIGAEVGGVLGIVIAVPAAAVFQEIIDDWSSKKRPATETVI
ncbi:MAG: AI-2E family transporter [Candidatus Liptonbacteria bacterium]|nr:AI-2E family transporter [Candidatus Liptonbacteria bacterium]